MTRLVHSGTEGPDAAPRCLRCRPAEHCKHRRDGCYPVMCFCPCDGCKPCACETVRSCRECDTPRYDTREEEALDK